MQRVPAHIAQAVTNRGLKLILNPTEQCNLRCTYCYESFALKEMPGEVISGILHLVSNRAAKGLDWLEVEFFGGEPLAAWGVVESLAKKLSQICEAANVSLLGSATTNATLLYESRFEVLCKYGFNAFQITLDGPEFLHNSRRKTARGKGTFDIIWRNLKQIRRSHLNANIMLRVHFDPDTVFTLASGNFIDILHDEFLKDDARFSLHFKPIEAWSDNRDIKTFQTHNSQRAALDRLLERAKVAGICESQLPQLTLQPQKVGESGHIVCYAARANSFIIRSDGRVSKCTVAFDDDRNVVGRIMQDGTLQIEHERHMQWLRGLVTGDSEALCCPAVGIVWASP